MEAINLEDKKTVFRTKLNHDVRSCFNAILGYQNILKEEAIDNLDPEHANFIERMGTRSQEGIKILDELQKLYEELYANK